VKALTVQDPWATLIADGRKLCENRSWRPHGVKVGERFAIHRGGKGGCIIATVRLLAVTTAPHARRMLGRPQWKHIDDGGWCWIIGEVRRLRRPVPCSGRLGLWDAPPSVK
jgi:hypothetical protein